MRLINPSLDFKDSWLATIAELKLESPDLSGPGLGVLMSSVCDPHNLEEYIRLSKAFADGKELPDGWVSCTNYWLVDGEEFIGSLNFRHRLNERLSEHGGHVGYFIRPSKQNRGYGTKMLELGLERIKDESQLSRVMITCNDSNIRSRKVIEKNGGVFERYSKVLHEGEKIRIYWITL